MLFYKLNESMRHLLYFLLLVCFLGNIKAQKSVGQVNGFYICSKKEDYMIRVCMKKQMIAFGVYLSIIDG